MGIDRYFPYGQWRRRQRDIAAFIYESLSMGRAAFVEAPTGLGKTTSALSGALAYVEEEGGRIVWLVRTRNEALAPVRELLALRKRGIEVPFVVLRNKRDMCCYVGLKKLPYEEFIEECRYLVSKGRCEYYASSTSGVQATSLPPGATVTLLCSRGVCPYEAVRGLVGESAVVVASYYYVFSAVPVDMGMALDDAVLVIDEAHSLPEAISSINSAELREHHVRRALREARELNAGGAARALRALLRGMAALRGRGRLERGEALELFEGIDELNDALRSVADQRYVPYTALRRVVDFYNRLVRYPSTYGVFVESIEGSTALSVRLLDPATVAAGPLARARGVVMMSGTLPDPEALGAMLGIERPHSALRIDFSEYVQPRNYMVVVDVSLTSRFSERSESLYAEYASRLLATYEALPRGGLLAVFPSYDFMRGVRKYMDLQGVPYVMERADTDMEGLRIHVAHSKYMVLGVAGGKLTEGVEYLDDRGTNTLAAVAVVGVPYPEPSDYLKAYVDALARRVGRGRAWSLAYPYSAAVKVGQAIGRLFRGPEDRGMVMLMDRRYLEEPLRGYLKVFEGGRIVVVDNGEDLARIAATFYSQS